MIRTLQYVHFKFLILGVDIPEHVQDDVQTTVASNNGNQTKTDRFHDNKTIWFPFIDPCTIWIWICALLCTLYIGVGIPLLKYLNRSDDETEEVTKEVTKDTPKKFHADAAHHTMYIRNLIAKSQAISNSAFNSSRLIEYQISLLSKNKSNSMHVFKSAILTIFQLCQNRYK